MAEVYTDCDRASEMTLHDTCGFWVVLNVSGQTGTKWSDGELMETSSTSNQLLLLCLDAVEKYLWLAANKQFEVARGTWWFSSFKLYEFDSCVTRSTSC